MHTETKQSGSNPRPIILEIEDTKTRIIQEINSAIRKGIPCYLLKDAFEGVLSQIREGAKAEIEAVRAKENDQAKTGKKEETE